MDMATRAPPVTKPTATGRTCAKRMIMPLPALFVTTAERLFSMEWLHQACNAPPRLVRPPLDTMLSARRYSHRAPVPRLPVASRLITMSSRRPGATRSRLLLGRSAAAGRFHAHRQDSPPRLLD